MDYEKLKEVIAKKIKENGRREITGPVLQAVLMAMVDSLGEVYPQTYTEEEKAQARANIDALSDYDGEITKEKLSIEVQAILNDVANKQNITDESLATIAKTIVGAINELFNGGIKDKSIATSKIKDGAVTDTKIVSGAVTTPKIANDAVTTEKVNDGAITEPKLDTDLANVITSAVQPAELASAIATALASYVAKTDIVSITGSATDKVMSQHGVTEAINGVNDKLTELDKEINGCEAISIVDENVLWEQKLDKKVNVSAYKGKTIKVKTSSDNIEPAYSFNLYIMTGPYSGNIMETRSLHVGDSTEIEITEDINYIWLFSGYTFSVGRTLYVQIYIDGVKGLADDIVEIKESTLSNVLKIEQTETQIKVSNKNLKGNTTTIMFKPFGVNNLWQIRSVEIYDSSDNLLVMSTTDTDSVGPYQVGAVNNADGDNIGTAVADFTGGCHGYNGDQTGSATASSSVKVNSLNGILDVVVTNRIQGYNTRKANGTGREIIVEEVHYVFESGVDGFKVNNFIKALEDVTIKLYYGMQIAFARDFVKFNSGEIGKWKGQSLNATYDGNSLDSVAGKSDTGLMQEMYVLDRGLGHFGFVPSNIPKAFQSGKIYYNLIRQNVSLEVDDTLFFEGGYIFDYVGSPVE